MAFVVCGLWIGKVVITTTALIASPDGDQDPSNELWAFKERTRDRITPKDSFTGCTPRPAVPGSRYPLPHLPLLLRHHSPGHRCCSGEAALPLWLSSYLLSVHMASQPPFLQTYIMPFSSLSGCQLLLPPLSPGNTAWEAERPTQMGGRGVSLPGPHSSWKPNAHTGPLKVTLNA